MYQLHSVALIDFTSRIIQWVTWGLITRQCFVTFIFQQMVFFPEDKYTTILCIHVAAENSHLGAAQYNYSRVLGVIEMISARAVQ